MEKLQEMMSFARVVETKSFSAAAESLGTSKSVVSKQVSELEATLGVKLLHRTTRSMSLTEVGAAYYEHCLRILQEIEAANETVQQLQTEPRGILRITSPVVFATMHLQPALSSFLKQYPKVEVELNASDRVVDMVEERYDIAIRITDNPLPSMVARRLATLRWVTCASPDYFARRGRPAQPQDLLAHDCLVYLDQPATRQGWLYRIDDKAQYVRVHGRLRINNTEGLLKAALDGQGIVVFPTYVVGKYLRSGELEAVLEDAIAYPDMSLVAMYPSHKFMQPKVRVFVDHMLATFGQEPYWDQY